MTQSPSRVQRLLLVMSASFATLSCLLWIYLAYLEWSSCCQLLPYQWTPVAVTVVAFVNVLGLVTFAARSEGWGWVALAIVQLADISFSYVGLAAHAAPPWHSVVNPIMFIYVDPPAVVLVCLLLGLYWVKPKRERDLPPAP